MRMLLVALSVVGGLLVGGCAATGTPAAPLTVGGRVAKLVDADPCIYNGDSGCTDHSLGGQDLAVCVSRGGSLPVDTGAPAARVTASAGARGDHEWVDGARPKHRVRVSVRRVDDRRFTVTLPRALPRATRVLHVVVAYRGGVLTPYVPLNSHWLVASDAQSFKRGVYAVRVRTTC